MHWFWTANFGPLSDAIGRRKLCFTGAVIYGVTTYCLTLSTDLVMFLAIRVIQGLFYINNAGYSNQRSSRCNRGSVAATLYAIIITIEGVVPIASPLLGG